MVRGVEAHGLVNARDNNPKKRQPKKKQPKKKPYP